MIDQTSKYIIDLLNIKVESDFAILEISNELSSVSNPIELVQYIKDNLNSYDLQYLTGFQKFVTLAKRYKKDEVERMNSAKIEKMGTAAERLALKVKEIDTIVLNSQNDNHEWDRFKLSTGEQYFNEREIKALEAVGTPLKCIRLQRSVSGRDMLAEKLEVLFVQRVTNQIALPHQSNSIIASLAKSVTTVR